MENLKESPCSKRIKAQLKDRMDDIDKALSVTDPEAKGGRDELANKVLAIDVYRTVKIELSTGGPADWFEITFSNDGDLLSGTYHFADWYDHADRVLSRVELDKIVDVYFGGDITAYLP